LIVRRHAADCARPVAKQHVISDPDWNLFVCRWIDCVSAGKHAGFFFRQIRTFELTFARGSFAIFSNRGPLFLGNDEVDQRIFRREH
jgi:hypothetical protein